MEILAELLRNAGQGVYPCLFHLITGAYCPGCGGTRAAFCLLNGEIVTSVRYNPVVLYLAVCIPILLFVSLYRRRKGKQLPDRLLKGALYVGILIMAVNFVVKNYYLLYLHQDLLKQLDSLFPK